MGPRRAHRPARPSVTELTASPRACRTDTLNETHRRLSNAGQLIQGTTALAELLEGDGEFNLMRSAARSETARLAEVDPNLVGVRELLDAAEIQVGEANDALARYRDALDLTRNASPMPRPDRQTARTYRKHRLPVAQLKVHAQVLRDDKDCRMPASCCRSSSGAIEREYLAAAAKLSRWRADRAAAGRDVSALMDELECARKFRKRSSKSRRCRTGPVRCRCAGRERVEFRQRHPANPCALRKAASGEELSRISLAIEVAALGLDDRRMVFDEVDAGIGGAIAEVVIAAPPRRATPGLVRHASTAGCGQGHHHLLVAKQRQEHANAHRRARDKRAATKSRMLGGIEITRETLAHAKQMLAKGYEDGLWSRYARLRCNHPIITSAAAASPNNNPTSRAAPPATRAGRV